MKYSILVNTCDMYSDCWNPFFVLFKKYWPDYNGKIYLNTEYKDYSYPGLNIISNKICLRHGCNPAVQPSWSQRLTWALEQCETEVVLFMQEDFFLRDKVDNNRVSHYAEVMLSDENLHCLHLTNFLNGGGILYNDEIENIRRFYAYRIDCQAALWKKGVMLYYLDVRDSAWEFEKFGSWRASFNHHRICRLNKEYLKENPIIPYYSTGINKSRWQKGVVEVFRENGIEMDFSIRGFYEDMKPPTCFQYLMQRIRKIPGYLRQIPILIRLIIKYYFIK